MQCMPCGTCRESGTGMGLLTWHSWHRGCAQGGMEGRGGVQGKIVAPILLET